MPQGLLFYYCRQVLLYALQATLLLCLAAALLGALVGKPGEPLVHMIWLYLNLLAGLGPLAGIALEQYFYRDSQYLYANHGLTRWLLYPPAVLLIWIVAALGSLGMQIYDGRFQQQLQYGQSWWDYGLKLSSQWLSRHPEALWGAGLLALLGLSGLLIFWLSGPDPGLEEDPEGVSELSIDSALHSYGPRQVLKGAWLKIRSGEVVGLLGRNGCGKSTLLQILFGTLKADFRGLFLNGHPVRCLCALGVAAYLPQRSILPPLMRVNRAIRLFAGENASGLLAQEPRITELLHKRVGQLSGGEKRLLELGLVLSLEKPFVLLDEPFSELEPIYKARVRDWIVQASRQGSAIVVTDHDYSQILKISDRLLLMHQGQTEVVKDETELRRLYLPVI